jgi:hypothetical protein
VLGLHPTVGGAHACQNIDQTSETSRYFSHVDIVKLAHQRSTLMLAVPIFNTNERHTICEPPLVHACDLIQS